MQISNVSVNQQFPTQPYQFSASASVVMGDGEIYMSAVVRIYPANDSSNYAETSMGQPSGGVITCSWATAPAGTSPPFKARIIANGLRQFTEDSGEVNVG